MKRIEIALECRIESFQQGVGTALLSLAHALCELPGDAEHFTFIVFEDHKELFAGLPVQRASVLTVPRHVPSSVKAKFGRVKPLRDLWRMSRAAVGPLPASDGILEEKQFDVVHFPTQVGYLTQIPSIYQPWDLQHVHLSQFFSRDVRIWRNRVYRAMCGQARFVSVQTEWGKSDLISQYGVEAEKIAVIPWGSVLNAYPQPREQDIASTRDKYNLPDKFLFFPAITWPHKNHELAIRAVAELKREGFDITLICTGDKTDRYGDLLDLAQQCAVADRVRFLGFVSPVELQSIYSLAVAMIFPSRFEGFGLPVMEAFQCGLPVICARATVLPEVAGDAALFFDPDDPKETAQVIRLLASSPALRSELISRGRDRSAGFPISRAAERFRDLYHRAAGDYIHPVKAVAMETPGVRH